MSLLSKIGKSATSTKALAGVGAVSAIGLGVSDTVGPTAADAMMEIGLGDPEADRYFLGGDSSFRYLAGTLMGGTLGSAMRASAPSDYMRENPYVPTVAGVGVAGLVGGAVGGGVGFAVANKALGASQMGIGRKSLIMGAASIVGASVGLSGAVGSTLAGPVAAHSSQNQEFLSQSPYSSSRATAANLNANGNIVLGMHNSRRGY